MLIDNIDSEMKIAFIKIITDTGHGSSDVNWLEISRSFVFQFSFSFLVISAIIQILICPAISSLVATII